MGFFQKIIDGLRKTKERIGFKLNEIFKRGIFDDDFYEECVDRKKIRECLQNMFVIKYLN